MMFRILGGLEARANGVKLPLSRGRERVVLAVLLIHVGRPVPVSRLVNAVWGIDPPVTAVKQVRNTISRLRGLLTAHGFSDMITTTVAAYQLEVADEDVDIRVFNMKLAEAERAASAGRIADAARVLRAALDLSWGPLLAGFQGEVFETAGAEWDERLWQARQSYHSYMLTLGRHREILADLCRLVAECPLSEEVAGQLMLALYRCGRSSDALQVYINTRAALADELGVDPGLTLQDMHLRILNNDPTLAISDAQHLWHSAAEQPA